MRFDVVTIFPELIAAATGVGLVQKALQSGILQLRTRSPRDFARDRHRSVDDAPYGGGSGMVMMPEPLMEAVDSLDADADSLRLPHAHRILLTPQGQPFDQAMARQLAHMPALMLICGRYEGVDERVREQMDQELSLGDFVLNGGEIAALAVIEAVGRLVPGMVGNAESLTEESHAAGLLEYPQYTRPRVFRGRVVPDVLLSGNHAEITRFRRRAALLRTRARRPDLFARVALSDEDERLLDQPDADAGAGAQDRR